MKKRVNDINEKNLKDRFIPPKSMPKKEVAKIKAGTWIEVWYKDAPNGVVLLIEKMDREQTGEVSMKTLDPTIMDSNWRITNRQVVRVLGNLSVPTLTPGTTRLADGTEVL